MFNYKMETIGLILIIVLYISPTIKEIYNATK